MEHLPYALRGERGSLSLVTLGAGFEPARFTHVDRRLDLGVEHEQLAPRLQDDAADLGPRAREDLAGFPVGGGKNVVTQTNEVV